jgi:hypothetical protein
MVTSRLTLAAPSDCNWLQTSCRPAVSVLSSCELKAMARVRATMFSWMAACVWPDRPINCNWLPVVVYPLTAGNGRVCWSGWSYLASLGSACNRRWRWRQVPPEYAWVLHA